MKRSGWNSHPDTG